MADPKQKITVNHREPKVEVFSDRFKDRLRTAGYKPVHTPKAETQEQGTPISGVKEGNLIEHQRFGVGKVLKVEGTGENTKATVEFKNAGTKQLLLKFAKFNIIG